MTAKETPALRCPHCDMLKLKYVTDSRGSSGMVRRRRQCQGCGQNATTLEFVVGKDLRVDKPDLDIVQEIAATGVRTDPNYPNALVTYP